MVNINMTHVFRHPKFYRIPRDKSDQVISDEASTEATSVRYVANHLLQGKAFRGDLLVDRGSRNFHKVSRVQERRLGL